MKPETNFRTNRVYKDLDTLPGTERISIQQLSSHGDPDLILCIHGDFIWLEAKAEDGKETKLQEHKRMKFQNNAGARTYVARPSNWPFIFAQLKILATKGGMIPLRTKPTKH